MSLVKENQSIYVPDKSLTEVLANEIFTISAEVLPPRNGQSRSGIFSTLDRIVSAKADFLSVTKGAGGSLRGGSLPIAQAIKEHYAKPCVAHFTCRDLIPVEIENLLMDHHYFGVRNILALRGDPPMGETQWKPREGGYSYAYELIDQIVALNQGEFLKRSGFQTQPQEKTDFCIGCAVYPEHPDSQERVLFTKEKFLRGAEYGMTQMIFDPELYQRFLSEIAKEKIFKPILPGLRILRSKKQGQVMRTRFGCSVPDWYMKALPEDHKNVEPSEALYEQILEPFLKMVEGFKKQGAPGVHVFVLNDLQLFERAMARLKKVY